MILSLLGWISVFLTSRQMLTSVWRLPAIAVALSVLVMKPVAGVLNGFIGFKRGFVSRMSAVLVGAGILSGVLLILNVAFERPGTEVRTERLAVSRLYRTEHRHTRRVGKRYIPTGSVYYRYHAEVELTDGRKMEIPVSSERYSSMRGRNDSIEVAVHHGLLGADYLSPRYKKY